MLGLTIGDKHTYNDWGLLFDGNASYIGPANAKRYSVDVPGADGTLDLTYALSSRLRFYDRQVHLEFKKPSVSNWVSLISTIQNYLQGQTLHIVKDWDSSYYWDATLEVADASTDDREGRLVIEGTCKPYKFKSSNTVKTITGSGTLNCTNGRMPVCPSITVTDDTTIALGSKSWALEEGTSTISDLILDEGDNNLTITTDGTVTVTYREGSL